MMTGFRPWRILADCPAPRHNTLNAERGAGPNEGVRCICPRAVAERARYMKKQAEDRRRKRLGLPSLAESGLLMIASYWTNTGGKPAPDLTGAACATKRGQQVMSTLHHAANLAEARGMCARCPVAEACLSWAMDNERPAGAWDGMYGGLTERERLEMSWQR